MTTVETVLIVVLALLAAAITAVVILQQGRGADIGAAFGAGGANTIFGSAGLASPLAKLTWGLAGLFLVLCMSLAYIAKHRAEASNAATLSGDVPASAGSQPANGDIPSLPTQSRPAPGDVPVIPSAPAPKPAN